MSLTAEQSRRAKAAYEFGVPSTLIAEVLGGSASTTVKRLRSAGATIRPRGQGTALAEQERTAFLLGVEDGRELDSPDDELSSGRTWTDQDEDLLDLNELYDLGVNLGACTNRKEPTCS